jgi:hypothetical protein
MLPAASAIVFSDLRRFNRFALLLLLEPTVILNLPIWDWNNVCIGSSSSEWRRRRHREAAAAADHA